tara:strand:- start:327 stop:611 length:285 start_codon:yes stop_codon:yes gene_type:complete
MRIPKKLEALIRERKIGWRDVPNQYFIAVQYDKEVYCLVYDREEAWKRYSDHKVNIANVIFDKVVIVYGAFNGEDIEVYHQHEMRNVTGTFLKL